MGERERAAKMEVQLGMQLTPLLSFTLSGKEDMRHTESAALRDRREGASADDAQQHQVGNAPRCRTVALPLDHREVQGVLCQHNEQVSREEQVQKTHSL